GVSDVLALRLGLENLSPLVPANDDASDLTGLGRIGLYSPPVTAPDFMTRVLDVLALPAVQMAGKLPEKIVRVAVCGGSGKAR
ncbi:MAG: Nif3-like dinuclear metal center hexameric protein, partial [Desulforhopalus sp.]